MTFVLLACLAAVGSIGGLVFGIVVVGLLLADEVDRHQSKRRDGAKWDLRKLLIVPKRSVLMTLSTQ